MSAPHNARERLLDAAREVFAQFGSAGATTRRIAESAGVNEVTIFRHFGSKEALLDEAARAHVTGEHAVALPDTPQHPQQELTAWCAGEIERLRASRTFILQCLSEELAHPELGEFGALSMAPSARELTRYLETLRDAGRLKHPDDCACAVTLLLGAVYADAFGRPNLPDVITAAPTVAPAQYVRLVLRALGAR